MEKNHKVQDINSGKSLKSTRSCYFIQVFVKLIL